MITPRQRYLIKALNGCSLPIATNRKRFIRQMGGRLETNPDQPLTDAQGNYLEILRHHFRRQFSKPCDCTSCAVNGVQQEIDLE